MNIRTVIAGVAVIVMGTALGGAQPTVSEQLEKGVYLEQTKGDFTGAIEVYEKLIDQAQANRVFLARAHYRLGVCQLKLGQKSRAVTAFKKVLEDYPDQTELAARARLEMPLVVEETYEQIERNYFQDIDRRELMETAIRAMVGKLDKSSDYLDPVDFTRMKDSVRGSLVGIGAKLRFDRESGLVTIISPLTGSPAASAGLRAGDQIVQIDGREQLPEGKELETAVELIRGIEGDPVILGIRRAGEERVEQIRIVRGSIRLDSVVGDRRGSDLKWDFMLDEARKIGYVRILYFAEGTAGQVKAAVENLEGRGMKGLVLDLRNDPGGLLSEAVGVSDLFIEEGPIVTSKGRQDNEHIWSAKAEGTHGSFPMAVLINRLTASAAEIVGACLQDHGRAVLIGERTLGQGLVKSLIPLEGGESALKLPVARFYRPNGKNMHRQADATEDQDWGVSPNPGFELKLSEEEAKRYSSYREKRDEGQAPGEEEKEFEDRLLVRALRYLEERLTD